MTPVLTVTDLTVHYGKLAAVHGVSLEVGTGSIVAVLGSNGVGKSSTLNAVTGNIRATVGGTVEFDGQRVTGAPAHRIARQGMVLVPEGRQVVAPLTVEENLVLGSYLRRVRRSYKTLRDEVYDMFPILKERRAAPAGLLSGGEQQMLAFGRALMTMPKVVLLDEPSMGLSPRMVTEIMGAVRAMRERGLSVLMVEQNAAAALTVADDVYVMRGGRVALHGDAATVAADTELAAAFLGAGV